ncbi:hypothetical protein JYG30_11525 [Fibrella sp. USSR17]
MAANSYTPSVNIIRDVDRELVYYPTQNARRVISQLVEDYKKGLRAFNIVGAYGTGKSSLLWALEQSLRSLTEKDRKHFFDVNFVADPAVDIISIVGEYASIIDSFATRFNAVEPEPKAILSEVYNAFHDLKQRAKGQRPLLFLFIDEFGKFLEYAAKHEPEREFYFIQQLAEFANTVGTDICLITTVHQNIDAYSAGLTEQQRKEWTKVRGRFKEVTFNEPVEQLLFLASEHIGGNPTDAPTQARIETARQLALQSHAVRFNSSFDNVPTKLFPLDLLSATTLTFALQYYGQNDRSLFSFLEATDHTGMSRTRLSATNPVYSLANVFDYLTLNFYSYLNSRDNRHYAAWTGMKNALEKVEALYGEEAAPYEKLIKTVGLLSLLMPERAKLDRTFLTQYGEACLGLPDTSQLISDLEEQKVMRYRNYRTRYSLNEGTDLDFHLAYQQAGNEVDEIRDVSTVLQRYYQLPPVLAKKHSYISGTPRMFEYWISEWPISKNPTGDTDGFINLIFNETQTVDALREHALKHDKKAILFVFYQNTSSIRKQLFQIEKTQKVINRYGEDKIALRELEQDLVQEKEELTQLIFDGLYDSEAVTWLFGSKPPLIVSDARALNRELSQVCDEVYYAAPVFRNELVNRQKLSGQIGSAKRHYLQRLVNNWGEPNLGFDDNQFPPEKTIYLTLLQQNGLDPAYTLQTAQDEEIFGEISVPESSSFWQLWEASKAFIDSAKQSRRSVAEWIEQLSEPPFKLKQGLIEFWVPTFLFIKRDDFAFFEDGVYIPELSSDILELMMKAPQNYAIKAFGVDAPRINLLNSYRHLFNQSTQIRFGNAAFIDTVRPLLTFYRALPDYTKQTKRLSKEALAIRAAVSMALEPEKTFFEDFPTALGYSFDSLQRQPDLVEVYFLQLTDAIREIRTAHDDLISRFEAFLQSEYATPGASFESYKARLQDRFDGLNRDLLMPEQRTLLLRIDSPLDDRIAWLNSLVQAITGRSSNNLRDTDEVLLYDKFRKQVRQLDNLHTLSNITVDEEHEEVFSLQIGTLIDGLRAQQEEVIRMPAAKKKDVEQVEKKLRALLGTDSIVNIAALTNLIREQLQK